MPHAKEIIRHKQRNSNLELYRIIVMLLIVAHHYVVNSGLFQTLQTAAWTPASAMMLLFGAWGKTGINCFMLITGYFMCKSEISGRKLLKLYLQITFYTLIIYLIFCITGHENLSPLKILWTIWPIKSLTSNDFVSCFLMFYLFIPFINILIKNLDGQSHLKLVILLSLFYGFFPTIPLIPMTFSYVSWFMALYVIAAYIRLYGLCPKISRNQWGCISIILILMGAVSITGLEAIYKLGITSHYLPYFFVSDSNKLLSLLIAVSSFMYFKDLKIPHSRVINALGAATFGVLLIHANSDTMRQWLWRETVDCVGHFGNPIAETLLYAATSVVIIFVVCAGIEWFRASYLEPHILGFFEPTFRKAKSKVNAFIASKTNG